MRFLVACFAVAAASAALPQSSGEFHNRYGEPTLERFQARPGISVTVEYGSDHLACRALIEPPRALFHTEENLPLMSSGTVTEILEEIVPAQVRGKEISRSVTESGCNEFEIVEYGNVTIMRSTHNCLPLTPERQVRAAIAFKRDICAESK
jgi:hypothetical protein